MINMRQRLRRIFRRERETNEKELINEKPKPVRRKVTIKTSHRQEDHPQNEYILMRNESIEKIFSTYKLQYNIASPTSPTTSRENIGLTLIIRTRELRKLL